MNSTRSVAVLFLTAAFYDGCLGLLFLVAPRLVYEWASVTPPNHWAYVQFPASLLIIFSLMFIAIATDPIRNRNLIVYGILLKVSYCAITMWYWFTAGIPGLWKPFAVIDFAMGVGFLLSLRALDRIKAT
jgi:hypothetical protein